MFAPCLSLLYPYILPCPFIPFPYILYLFPYCISSSFFHQQAVLQLIKFNPLFHPMLLSLLDHSRQAKYIKWKRKNKQAGDYIPIKILAAHIVIDMAEILEICEGKQNLCMNINTRAHTHTQFLEWCRSALSKQHIHPPRRSVAGFVGGLFTAHYPLCCYKIKALKLPMGHTEPSCVTEAAVCTYAY